MSWPHGTSAVPGLEDPSLNPNQGLIIFCNCYDPSIQHNGIMPLFRDHGCSELHYILHVLATFMDLKLIFWEVSPQNIYDKKGLQTGFPKIT